MSYWQPWHCSSASLQLYRPTSKGAAPPSISSGKPSGAHPEPPSQLLCPQPRLPPQLLQLTLGTSVFSARFLKWFSLGNKQNGASPPGERHEQQVSSENTSNLPSQPPTVITLHCISLRPRFSLAELICSILIHLLLSEGSDLKAAEITALGHQTWASAVKSGSRFALFRLKTRKLPSRLL